MNLVEFIEQAWWSSAETWREIKDLIELGEVGNATLHLIAGMVIFGAVLLAIKRPWRWPAAWATTLAVVLWNELVDISTERWPNFGGQLTEGAFDLVVTIAIPTLLWTMRSWSTRLRPAELEEGDDGVAPTLETRGRAPNAQLIP